MTPRTGGGLLVAVVGGDGAGKTTAVRALADGLPGPWGVRSVHVGRPPRSWTTQAVRVGVGLARRARLAACAPQDSPGTSPPPLSWLLEGACTARDRRRTLARARRWADSGTVVVCDRFPLPQLGSMDAPRGRPWWGDPRLGRLRAAVVRYEDAQYDALDDPDLLVVLRVDPETAVRRKSDEPADHVRRRSAEVWDATWDDSVLVVDAGRPAEAVHQDLRAAVQERL